MPLAKRKHSSSNSSPELEPASKRQRNTLGTPNFSSTPNFQALKSTPSANSTVSSPSSKIQSKAVSRLKNKVGSLSTPSSSGVSSDGGTPSVLKSILKTDRRSSSSTADTPAPITPIRSVSFEPVPKVVEFTLERMKSQTVSSEELKDLLGCILLNKGPGLILGLERLRENLDNLNNNHSGLIEEIAKLPWASHESEVSKAFQQLFICLLSHHPFYCKTVIKSLLKQLVQEDGENQYSTLSTASQKNVTRFVKVFLRNFPREKKELLKQVQANFPFYKQLSNRFSCYLEGVLVLYKYMSDAGPDILEIVVENVIKLDASIPRSLLRLYVAREQKLAKKKITETEDEGAESSASVGEKALDDSSDDDSGDEADSSAGLSGSDEVQCRKMDDSMVVLFNFVKDKCFATQEAVESDGKTVDTIEDPATKLNVTTESVFSNQLADPLVKVLLRLFTSHILTSDKLQSIQFIIFFIINQSKTYIKEFLSINWEVFKSVNHASIIRQAAISHFSGFLCRSQQVGPKTLKKRLNQLVTWIQAYMARDNSSTCDYMLVNLASHGPFYSACQAAFYIIAFRHRDLVEDDDVSYLRSLQLNSIISHPLNPLRVVAPSVVNHFSKVVTFYQIAYCNNILQRNQRITLPVLGLSSSSGGSLQGKPLLLDDHFPYQPYILPRTKHLVDNMYRQFEKLKDYVSDTSSDDEADESMEMEGSDMASTTTGGSSRRRTTSASSRRSRTVSVTDMISQELDII